jgi:uncharacterized membrane protein YtjA (UPF0391 family)
MHLCVLIRRGFATMGMDVASLRVGLPSWKHVCTICAFPTMPVTSSWAGVDSDSDPFGNMTCGDFFMLRYAAIFLIIAIVAAVFGFGGIAAGATEIAKVLFFIFIVIFLVTLLMGVIRR